jgi:hypothetical protein
MRVRIKTYLHVITISCAAVILYLMSSGNKSYVLFEQLGYSRGSQARKTWAMIQLSNTPVLKGTKKAIPTMGCGDLQG